MGDDEKESEIIAASIRLMLIPGENLRGNHFHYKMSLAPVLIPVPYHLYLERKKCLMPNHKQTQKLTLSSQKLFDISRHIICNVVSVIC